MGLDVITIGGNEEWSEASEKTFKRKFSLKVDKMFANVHKTKTTMNVDIHFYLKKYKFYNPRCNMIFSVGIVVGINKSNI
mgnify:CR=1 FL=1